jgi:uncharacterized protein YjbI with pentapeptide repeats
MAVSLSYRTTDSVPVEVRKAILAAARQLNRQRPWWGEGLVFFTDPKWRGYLTGDTKLFRSRGGDEDDQFMAFHDARFILLTLARWSREHGLSWVVEMEGEEVGRIAGGTITPAGLFEAAATSEQLQADDERARHIHAGSAEKKPGKKRKASSGGAVLGGQKPGKGEAPRQLQGRWTEDLIARARKALTQTPLDLEALKSIFGDIVIDGHAYIDCRGFKLANEAIKNPQAAHIDFSHSQFDYPLADARLQNCRFVGLKSADMVVSGEYIGCDFTGANLRRSSMTARFRMEGCNFTRAECSGSEWVLANYHECLFAETIIKRVEWTLCKFSKCTFTDLVLKDAFIAGCSFIEPTQNMKWFDAEKKVEMTHVVREDAPWLDWHGAHISDLRIR